MGPVKTLHLDKEVEKLRQVAGMSPMQAAGHMADVLKTVADAFEKIERNALELEVMQMMEGD
jgi:hypothetical protein